MYARDRAIILKRTSFGEADDIVTFFGLESGRLAGIAKSARKSVKRFGGALLPGSVVNLQYTERRGSELVWLEEATLILPAFSLTKSLSRLAALSSALRLALSFLKEKQRSGEKFHVLESFLGLLCERDPTLSDLTQFELSWLRVNGFAPVLDRCTKCSCRVNASLGWTFVPSTSGLTCPACTAQSGEDIPLSSTALQFSELVSGSREAPDEEWHAVRGMTTRFVEYVLGKPFIRWDPSGWTITS